MVSERVVVIGCGGIGGVVAASLALNNVPVLGVSGNPEIAAAITRAGLRATFSDGASHQVQMAAVEHLRDVPEPIHTVILAVPPNRCEAAARDLQPLLAADGKVVCLANGLVEERLAAILGSARVMGGVVAFGASMLGPGVVEQTSSGGVVFGHLEGGQAEVLASKWAQAMSNLGTISHTENLRGARWSKLAINCAISSLGALGGARLGALMRHRFVRRLCLEIMTEVTQVALAERVELEKVAGTLDLEWMALDDDERLLNGSPSLFAKHTVLLAVGAKYRRLRSSVLAAIERGREPPVDFLNGEVVARAETNGISVPINRAISQKIYAIARGEVQPGLAQVQALYGETRTVLREMKWAA